MKTKIRSLLRLAWPYLAMILLPLLSVGILCGYIFNNYTEKLVSDQSQTIQVAVDRVDQKLGSVEEMAYLIAENDSMKRYVVNGMSGNENDLFACSEVKNLLSGVSQNDNIAEIYFYDTYGGRIIATKTVLNDPALFFKYWYRIDGLPPQDAVALLESGAWGQHFSSAKRVSINNVPKDIVEYRTSLLLSQYGQRLSQLTFSIDAQKLFQELYDALNEGAEFYIYGSEGLLYSSGDTYLAMEQEKLSGELRIIPGSEEKLYGAELTFRNTMWKVRYYYPSLSQAAEGQEIVGQLLPAILLPLLLSICMCVFFTHNNHKEIVGMLALLRGDNGGGDNERDPQYIDYKLVRLYAGRMAQENSAYKKRFHEIHDSQKQSVLEHLVRGAYRGSRDSQKSLDSLELHVGKEPCAAMCVQFDDPCDTAFTINDQSLPDLIAEVLETHAGIPMEVFHNPPTEIVCIFSVGDDPEAAADSLVSLLNVQIRYRYGIDLRIGVGSPVDSILDIHRSYDQANEVIRYGESTGKAIHIYWQMDNMDELIFYPVQADEKITNYIIAGLGEEAKSILQSIYKENFSSESKIPSPEAIALLKYRTTNVVTSVAARQGIPLPVNAGKLLTEKNVKRHFISLMELVDRIVEEIQARKTDDQNALAVKVYNFVAENYMNTGLSVKEVAKHFHFHENYISNQYKEEYGESLSSAIERVRIEKAAELLRDTEERINEIAVMVGYSSAASFRRAFKKVTGIAPVEYRQSHERK